MQHISFTRFIARLLPRVLLGNLIIGAAALAAPAPSPFRFVLDAGITAGGDKLADVDYTNGYSTSIKAGGLVQVGGGVQYHPPASAFAVLATVNYHVDSASARNGDVRFDRVPLEVLAFYQPTAGHSRGQWRLGGGWRHTLNARYREDFDYQPKTTVDFKDTDSLVVQVGYGTQRFWGALRYVNENFTVDSVRVGNVSATLPPGAAKVDGSHMGLFGYVSF